MKIQLSAGFLRSSQFELGVRICRGFNFDRKKDNSFSKMLTGKRFKQIVVEPTSYCGYCIDHVYHNILETERKVNYKLHYPYYSDHEAVCVMIKDS